MYKGTKGSILVGPRWSEEFSVNITLRQGNFQSNQVYHGDGAGKQEGKYERYSGEDVACGPSGCCGGE